jgi:hypothetical protein
MKCCSYLRFDLERHFKEMCRWYHILSGPDDPSLKHAFLASIPRDLADETFRLFKTIKKVIDNQSLGTIFHQVLEALNKIYDQHKYFTKILQPDKTMLRACKRPDLLIKCSDNVDCNCFMKKKKHFKKIHRSSFNGRQKKWKFLRWRHTRCPKHFTPSSNRCFIYKRKGHFEKNLSIKEGPIIKVNWFSGPKFKVQSWWRSWILILTYEWDHSWYHSCYSRWKFWWWDLWTLPSPTYHFPFTSNIFSPCYHSYIHIC